MRSFYAEYHSKVTSRDPWPTSNCDPIRLTLQHQHQHQHQHSTFFQSRKMQWDIPVVKFLIPPLIVIPSVSLCNINILPWQHLDHHLTVRAAKMQWDFPVVKFLKWLYLVHETARLYLQIILGPLWWLLFRCIYELHHLSYNRDV